MKNVKRDLNKRLSLKFPEKVFLSYIACNEWPVIFSHKKVFLSYIAYNEWLPNFYLC